MSREDGDRALRTIPWLYAHDREKILDAIEAAGLEVTTAEPQSATGFSRDHMARFRHFRPHIEGELS